MVRFSILPQLLGIVSTLLLVHPLYAQTELWGRSGEAWNPKGILPDFSFAGYRRGELPIPNRTPTVSVVDFGARSNADATVAIQKAIDENPGKCIEIPSGTFLISGRIRVQSPGTVLQGAGPGKTILHFTRSLQEIEPTQAKTGGGESTNRWSWSGGLVVVGDSGLEAAKTQRISGESKRGENVIQVDDLRGIDTGDDIRIEMWDDAGGSLTDYLYRGAPGEDSIIRDHTFVWQVATVVAIEGSQVTIDRPLRADVDLRWEPRIRKFVPKAEDCGLDGVTISFPARPYRGHWKEDGFNGVALNGTNNWVRNIEIRNADSGIYVTGQFNTVDGVTVTADRTPHGSGITGHHGLTTTGQDCLITHFRIKTKFFHDLTVDKGAIGNVFSEGRGVDLCLDHHRFAPYENLFTAIDLGLGTRPWSSGGASGKGRHSAAGATFWNIDSNIKIRPPEEDFGPRGLIFVGLNAQDGGIGRPTILPGGWYYEPQRPGRFEPANLHRAQLARRLRTQSP